MKKGIIVLLIAFLNNIAFAQTKINVAVKGQIFNANFDSIKISHFYGTYYKDYLSVPITKDGKFTIKGELPSMDFYVLRMGKNQAHLVLRDKSDITVYGDGKNISQFCNFINSDESQAMNKVAKLAYVFSIAIDCDIAFIA